MRLWMFRKFVGGISTLRYKLPSTRQGEACAKGGGLARRGMTGERRHDDEYRFTVRLSVSKKPRPHSPRRGREDVRAVVDRRTTKPGSVLIWSHKCMSTIQ